jgi:uncharacterized phage protein gp47/JayE
MWESMTEEAIKNEALAKVSDDTDKREGSLIYDSIAGSSYTTAEFYYYLDVFLNMVFPDTAVDAFLDKIVSSVGITRKAATYAVRKVTTSGAVSIGTRWGINGLVYSITSLIDTNIYSATCETTGDIGNTYSGPLENIDNVTGITASISDILASGEDLEDDEYLRTRYYSKVRNAGTSGNIHDYRNWALDVPGCGDAKVYPVWDGAGTVKVLVVDENMEIDAGLPITVAAYIDTVRPIGATVTVASPSNKMINVTANVMLDGTKSLAEVQSLFTSNLTAYLKDTIFEIYSLSYAKVGSILLSTFGVEDYDTLLVNTGTINIAILDTEMPIAGTITLTEAI